MNLSIKYFAKTWNSVDVDVDVSLSENEKNFNSNISLDELYACSNTQLSIS